MLRGSEIWLSGSKRNDIFALSLELLVGGTGLVCFGHAALFGVYGFLALGFTLLVLRYIWVQSIWRLSVLLRRLRGKGELTQVPTARSCWLLTVGGVRGAVTLAGVMSVPMLMGADAFPERDLLIFIAAGVILLSLISACIALPILLRGVTKSPDERLHQEVQEAWRRTAEAARGQGQAKANGHQDPNPEHTHTPTAPPTPPTPPPPAAAPPPPPTAPPPPPPFGQKRL